MALVGSPIGKPWGRRLPVSVGGVLGRTYAEFQTQIATLATEGVAAWDTVGLPTGAVRSTPIATTSVLRGSPWQARAAFGASNVAGIAQHSAPSQAAFDAIVAGGFECFFQFDVSTGTTVALDRNGLLSTSGASASGRTVPNFIYWDGAQAQQINPFAGTGPTPYTW